MRSAIVFCACLMPALAASATATQEVPAASERGLPDRDPELARELVAQGALLLDVRTPAEFESGHIEGAVNVPVDELRQRMCEIEALTGGDKTRPIVVYCASGRRAGIAKEQLLAAGYQLVTNLGGIDDWYR